MPDAIFAEPRLAAIYDVLDGDRRDLALYLAIVQEVGASTVLDVGCGTGTLACLLAERGIDVIGLDPAAATLDVARRKPGAERVRWVLGAASAAPPVGVDLAAMTGNVAQVFVTDEEWRSTLAALERAVRPGGWSAFEVRDPSRRAWEQWTPELTTRTVDVPDAGVVTTWTELVEVRQPFVTFRQVFRFADDGVELTSESTLRFRERDEIRDDLAQAGFRVDSIRDAPDRPGLEMVFVAQRSAGPG